jgi:hypothetical protein
VNYKSTAIGFGSKEESSALHQPEVESDHEHKFAPLGIIPAGEKFRWDANDGHYVGTPPLAVGLCPCGEVLTKEIKR